MSTYGFLVVNGADLADDMVNRWLIIVNKGLNNFIVVTIVER